ncbi:MAG: D-tyrosyl-tRNA(Tyr) deacylase [Spirochaetaceae bacterium]|nr:MAG: D-tyrosyl-tRNA(Tyr) deacylase [Spirochaetaceae bacterium]
MRAVVQRVSRCRVESMGSVRAEVDVGLLVYLGVAADDQQRDIDYVADKIVHLRIFEDQDRKMNRDVLQTGGSVVVVSQFTLYGDTRKGRRPSYNRAAGAVEAERIYRALIERLAGYGVDVGSGVFQAHMDVVSVNDGPVTILVDSRKEF